MLFALLAVVLFGVGALAVDIGQAYAKRSLLQTDVDLAVMAAAAELTTGGACNQEVIDKATDFLNKADNKVPGQYPVDLGGSSSDNDGFIQCNNWKVTLWAPKSHVDFTLGKVLTTEPTASTSPSHAAAQINVTRRQRDASVLRGRRL